MSISFSMFRNVFAAFFEEIMDFFPNKIFLTSLAFAVTETFPILSNLSSPGLGRYVKLSQFCFERDINRSMQHGLELNRVRAGSGKPGKSWNMASGPGKVWEYVKLKGNLWLTVRRINIEILGKKGVNHEF